MSTGKFSRLLYFFTLLFLSCSAKSAEQTNPVTWGGFIDTYYAFDFNRPSKFDRSYTTQAARHNEFNINLAYLEAKVESDEVHARLALQAGTSVQSNYAGEPTVGSVSGPSLSRNIQEAFVGYRISENTWIDAGIFFSHVGLEGFISRDNLTYTRSLVADYSPYYQSGIRVSHAWSSRFSGQLHLLNGWQNISESNPDKMLGTQLSYAFTPSLSVTYNTLFGKEITFRQFHNFIIRFNPNDRWSFALQYDLGFQDNFTPSTAQWSGFSLIAKHQLTPNFALSGRVEGYSDPNQVIVKTATPDGLQAWGASVGSDLLLSQRILWRNEFRALSANHSVFPTRDASSPNNQVVVTSLAMGF